MVTLASLSDKKLKYPEPQKYEISFVYLVLSDDLGREKLVSI